MKVFISYAREDGEIAERLWNDLKRAGIDAWIDRKELLPGQNWKTEISKAIKASSHFIALLSTRSVSKQGFFQTELKKAIDVLDTFPEHRIYFIPVRIDECEPGYEKLGDIHWADLFPSYENGLQQILRVLVADYPSLESDYITTLQETKTYKAGLISFQKYSFLSRIFGLVKTLPKLPYADENRHVVVVEIRGNQPNILTVLKEPGYTFHGTAKNIDRLLFIFVEMRPHILVIENPADGYRLGDGYRIDAKFKITYKVEDAEAFWRGSRDQLAELEMSIIDAATDCFLKNSTHTLIGSEWETDIIVLQNSLEYSIYESCTIAGIKLLKVFADINIGDSLHERIHDKIYGSGGIAERRKIDQIIDSDRTFAPYNLRAVIHALDLRLLENFYTMKWSDAMCKVTERLAEKKEEYMKSLEQKELMRMQELVNAAYSLGLDAMDVEDIKSKIASKLISMADKNTNSHILSDNDFLIKYLNIHGYTDTD